MNKTVLTILVLSVALLMVACGQAQTDTGVIGTAPDQKKAAKPPTSTNIKQPTGATLPTVASASEPLHTPTETLIPLEALDPLFDEKQPGVYLVGVDIAPGVWRSQGEGDDCYWERNEVTGDLIDIHYGFAGGTMYIATTDFSVEMENGCGMWVFLQAP